MAQPVCPLPDSTGPAWPAARLGLGVPPGHSGRAFPSTPALESLWNRFVAVSPAMTEVLGAVLLHAPSRKPLLLVGATGTGKTTVAELVHAASGRSGGCCAHTVGELDPNLERSELLGHERGAFTGATSRRIGWLEEAGVGTLLLDDFHHMRRDTQVLLLRALDRGVFRRLGSMRDILVNCRVIIGFGEPPEALVRQGKLLPELFYRLGFSAILIPALEERREEIGPLALYFLAQAPAETGLGDGPARFAPGVLAMLEAGRYPGNVRELRLIVEGAYERARGEEAIREEHLPAHVRVPPVYRRWGNVANNRRAVQWALGKTGGDVGEAAALLGVHRNTVSALRWGLAAEGGSGSRGADHQ